MKVDRAEYRILVYWAMENVILGQWGVDVWGVDQWGYWTQSSVKLIAPHFDVASITTVYTEKHHFCGQSIHLELMNYLKWVNQDLV